MLIIQQIRQFKATYNLKINIYLKKYVHLKTIEYRFYRIVENGPNLLK